MNGVALRWMTPGCHQGPRELAGCYSRNVPKRLHGEMSFSTGVGCSVQEREGLLWDVKGPGDKGDNNVHRASMVF